MRRHLAVHSRLCTSWNAPLDKSGCLQKAGACRFHMGETRLWTWWGLLVLSPQPGPTSSCTLAVDDQKQSQILLEFGSLDLLMWRGTTT